MNLKTINLWSPDEARAAFHRSCGSSRWSREMEWSRPFELEAALIEAADRIWWALEPADWLEAFGAHPKIGAAQGARAAARPRLRGQRPSNPAREMPHGICSRRSPR